MKYEATDVQSYYETNTDSFLRFGEGGNLGAIHRAVRIEPSLSTLDAAHYVDSQLLQLLNRVDRPEPKVLDLGCGVGASMEYLLDGSSCHATGVSLSAVQVRYASERLARFGERARVFQGDFCVDTLPTDIDLAYGIESFVQAPDAAAFFHQAATALKPTGKLVLCDDFLSDSAHHEDAQPWIEEFRAGWRLSSLMSGAEADAVAQSEGFRLVDDRNWSPYLSVDRMRDKAIHVMVMAGKWFRRWTLRSTDGPAPVHAKWGNYLGGNALRYATKKGWLEYRFRVWERL